MPLPADPVPSFDDIQPYLATLHFADKSVCRELAEMRWALEKSQEAPDLFQVAYSTTTLSFAGFPTYQSYLRSARWKSIRQTVLSASNWECAGCQERATQVHHRDYRPRVLTGEDLTPLVPVCRACHGKIEAARLGRSWQDGERILQALVAQKVRSTNLR